MSDGIHEFISRLKTWFFTIWAMWYVFFSASLTLKPMHQIFWPVIVCVFVFLNRHQIKNQLNGNVAKLYVRYFFFILACAFTLIFSKDRSSTLLYIQKISLSFGFAVAVTADSNVKDIIFKVMSFYSLIMLAISFSQYLIPSFYEGTVLPLASQSQLPLVQNAVKSGESVGLTNGTTQNGLLMAIGFVLFSTRAAFKKDKSYLNIFIAALFFGMTFATGKRIFSLTCVGIFVLLLKYSMQNKRVMNRIIVIILLIVVAFAVFSFSASKIPVLNAIFEKSMILSENGDVTNGRLTLYNAAWEEFSSHIMIGIGANASLSYMGEATHNFCLQWLLEFGFPLVLVPFAAVFYVPLIKLKEINIMLKNEEDKDKKCLYMTAFSLALLLFLSAIVEVTFQWENIFMIFMIMQMILLSMYEKNDYESMYEDDDYE